MHCFAGVQGLAGLNFMTVQILWPDEDAGDGDEDTWIDLGTVKGYRRIVLVQELRDEVDLNTGLTGSWAKLLPEIVEARLFPTPWLNKVTTSLCPVRLMNQGLLHEGQYQDSQHAYGLDSATANLYLGQQQLELEAGHNKEACVN